MSYIIIGNGKVAKHFYHYFKKLNINCTKWYYKDNATRLDDYIRQATLKTGSRNTLKIFLLIKDDCISDFYRNHKALSELPFVFHCSGALQHEKIIQLHPLMTFSGKHYDFNTYKSIAFITTYEQDLNLILPELPNKVYIIPKRYAGYYHALCVMGGNFCQLLWQKFQLELQDKLDLPGDITHPYLQQVLTNFLENPEECLTGPLVRKDQKTVIRNLKSLREQNDPYQSIYQEFIKIYE